MSEGPKKAGVLGSPIAHSRSPQLHLAAYRALGLHDWTYERIECGAAELPVVVGGFGPEWVGVSVTMPGKFAALRFADERTARADLVGSANTLVRTPHGWRADNTDIDGVAGALGAAAGHALVLGSGGTAPAAVVGLAELGVTDITVVAAASGNVDGRVDRGPTVVSYKGGWESGPGWVGGRLAVRQGPVVNALD
ncbi:shikimate dehydrogenase, partial [Mycobacterium tuberculosis]|uniref:shikimate dehydrogenase n=1 Tax=Mycobacterium tuberculosis TaxID=1773 RepID=UPI0034CFC8E5